MKSNLKAVLLLGAAAAFGLNASASLASDAVLGDSLSTFRTPASQVEGLHLSVGMDFGSRTAKTSNFDFKLRYGQSTPQPGRFAPPALFDARLSAAGQWQSLKLSGVDVLNLKQRMQADGDDSNTAGWIIGGLVGVGVVAIIVRQIGNDDQESFEINRGLGGN